jgi:hypothetical protein
MAINKAFVVKNSLEVNQKLILADATTGRVGIGTSQPKYLLDVAGGIGVTDIYAVGVATFTGRLNVGTGGTVITALGTGLIGVGTINPVYLLDVRSPVSIGQTALYVRGDARITGDLVVEDDLILDEITTRNINVTGVSTFSAGPVIIGAATSTGTASQTLQVTGGGYVSGSVGIGVTNPVATLDVGGNIKLGANNVIWGLNQSTNYLRLYNTSTNGVDLFSSSVLTFNTNSLERARFDAGGNFLVGSASTTGTASQPLQVTGGGYISGSVGIGTTNPQGKLHVQDGTIVSYNGPLGGITTAIQLFPSTLSNTSGTGQRIEFRTDVLSGYIEGVRDTAGGPTVSMRLGTYGGEAIRILGTGNVGIGSTIPQVRLDVVGNAAISGFATISALGVSGITTTRNLQVIGVSTLGTVQVSSGIVTASAGIVTYYGDGSKLTGVIASGGGTIGVRSEGSYVGGGVTTLDFKTTTGTNVAVSAPVSGVSTVTIQPGVSLGLAIALGG